MRMLDHVRQTAPERLHRGPLGGIVDDFVRDMHARGHAEATIRDYVYYVERLGQWMAREGCTVETLSDSNLQMFVSALSPAAQGHARAAARRLLSTLRETGLVAPPVLSPISPVEGLIQRFLEYYRHCRGVRIETCRQYGRYVGEFLAYRFPAGGEVLDLAKIAAQDLMFFVAKRAERQTGAAKAAAKALRAFVRFLVHQGVCADDLVAAVPTVPQRQARLPRYLSDDQVRQLLASFDRSSPIGRRDRAMALCMVRLALRVGEVVGLRLEDIAWRRGIVQIGTGKSRRAATLPLPMDVGQAIARYLRDGRPETTHRHIFVTHALPVGRPLESSAARQAIRRAFQRSGLLVVSKGTHTLRHTAATRMVCQGASLKEVADVLRHRNLDTTVIYARVDLPALSSVAMPWPAVR